MKRRLAAIACGLLSAVVLSGCRGGPMKESADVPLQHREKIIAQDWVLKDSIRVAFHQSERVTGDLLKVKVGFENLKNSDLWCDIQVVFYDQGGFQAERTDWQPLLLSRSQITHFETTSLSPKVYDYSILLRDPRKSVK
jgi:hypothetical protein